MPSKTINQVPKSPFLIAGVDEVGRGPLAGSVVAAAVVLNPAAPVEGLLDSKLLSAERHASMLAMQRAIEGLSVAPHLVLVDGNRCPDMAYPKQAIVKGDQHVQAISTASIIAKVYRDRQMVELHEKHPEYGFNSHKGYPTAQHRAAIMEFGVLPLHRTSFTPVRNALMVKKDTTIA